MPDPSTPPASRPDEADSQPAAGAPPPGPTSPPDVGSGAEEAFHIPDSVALALTDFATVEGLSRGEAICRILSDYLRAKGYLRVPSRR